MAGRMTEDSHNITDLLLQWRSGQTGAADQLMELVYGELHQMAARQMRRERGEHTLQATAVVNEAYLRLCRSEPITWQDRAHFFAVAAQQLRRVLVDHARRVRSDKRGGDQIKLSLCDFDGGYTDFTEDMLALNEALERLQVLDERAAKVVEMRFFAGLDEKDIAEALNISVVTVQRDWVFARAWLAAQLM
jgi:RNA polymerase sigma factor (TIGR02999 family)